MKAQESIPKKYLFSYSYKSIISISLAKVSDKKVVYPFVSSLPFSKFWTENFMYFRHQYVEA